MNYNSVIYYYLIINFIKVELYGKVISIILNKVSVRRTGTSTIISTCHICYKYDKTNNALENRKYQSGSELIKPYGLEFSTSCTHTVCLMLMRSSLP